MTTIYARGSGNDTTGVGSLANPYLTFNKCTQVANPGDVINLDGTFSENITWTRSDSAGTAGNPIVVTSDDLNNPATFTPTSTFRIETDYVTIRGLIITGATQTAIRLGSNTGTTDRASNIIIEDCWIGGNRNNGMNLFNIDTATIQRNIFYDCRTRTTGSGAFGIYSNGGYIRSVDIRYNAFFDNGEDGIQFEAASASNIQDVNIEYNVGYITRGNGGITDRQVRPWRDFSNASTTTGFGGLVGENHIDLKRCTNVAARYNKSYQFEAAAEASQDVAGNDSGWGLVVHNGATGINLDFNQVWATHGMSVSVAGVATSNVTVRGNLIHDLNASSPEALNIVGVLTGVTVQHNTVVSEEISLWMDIRDSVLTSIKNNAFIRLSGSAGTFNRNTGNTNEASAFDYNARYNTGTWPTQWLPSTNDVAVTTPDLDQFYAPGASSDLLAAGTDVSLETLDYRTRPNPPSIGALEQTVALPAGVVLDWTGHFGLDLYFDSRTDTYDKLQLFPVPPDPANLLGRFGMAVWIGNNNISQAFSQLSLSDLSRVRCRFYLKMAGLSGGASPGGKTINLVKLFDDVIQAGSLTLRFDANDDPFIYTRMYGDNGEPAFIGGDQLGYAISREWVVIEAEWIFASTAGANDGAMSLWINDPDDATLTLIANLTGLDSDTLRPDAFQFGAMNISSGMAGSDDLPANMFYMHSLQVNSDGDEIGPVGYTPSEGTIVSMFQGSTLGNDLFKKAIL